MSLTTALVRAASSGLEKVSPRAVAALRALRAQPAHIRDLENRMQLAEQSMERLRRDISRLDSDLDESRRLNLRAAELLDITFTHLSDAEGAPIRD